MTGGHGHKKLVQIDNTNESVYNHSIMFTPKIALRGKYDVVVVGGGAAGITAAVSAARNGAKTLLVEQSAMLGGLGTNGLMTAIIAPTKHLGGIGNEIIREICSRGGAASVFREEYKTWVPYQNEVMKRIYDDIVCDAGVDLLLYTKLIGVEKNGKMIEYAIFSGAGELFGIAAKVFIDATGDAILSVFAGEDCELGGENGDTQAPTMVAYYANVDFDRYAAFLKNEGGDHVRIFQGLITQAAKDGVISILDLHHPGAFQIGRQLALVNVGHIYGADCSTSSGLTAATMAGRAMAEEYLNFYRQYVPGFENAYMTNTASTLGIRETRRVVGRYMLSYEDKKAFRCFADGVMRYDGGAGADLHASSDSKEAYKAYYDLYTSLNTETASSDGNEYCTMPYRSLLARKTDNLLIAGRCASTDRVVNATLRVMGYCFMMGQVTGTAAAQSVRESKAAADISIADLQRNLATDGIFNR